VRSLAIVLALPLLAAAQDKPKPQYPPYTVVVLAKVRFMAPKKAGELQARLDQIKAYARQVSREPVPEDNAGWEQFTFRIWGDSKFDVSILQRAFADVQCKSWELGITGTAVQDPQTKIIVVTSHGGKVKVKLMNRPKKGPNDVVDDRVAKVGEAMDTGRKYFTVQGEIYSHGGTLAILLSDFKDAGPPPEEK
jgi:hypothetical protein